MIEREPGDTSPIFSPRAMTYDAFGGRGQRLSQSAIHLRALLERKAGRRKRRRDRDKRRIRGWRAADCARVTARSVSAGAPFTVRIEGQRR